MSELGVNAPAALEGIEGGVDGGVLGGVVSGIVGGLTGAAPPPPPPPPPPPAPAKPVRIGGQISAPALLRRVEPEYPGIASAARLTGIVILEATIGTDGKVAQVTVLRSIPLLDAAALEAVRQWEFQPRVVDGVGVPLIYTFPVNFTLQ